MMTKEEARDWMSDNLMSWNETANAMGFVLKAKDVEALNILDPKGNWNERGHWERRR